MKTLKLFTLLFAAGIIAFSCKPGEGPEPDTAQQTFAKALEGTWTVPANGSIMKDSENITDVYPNFAVTFTANTSDAASISGDIDATGDNLPDVGNIIGSGTWTFSGTGIGSINLAGGAEITAITFSNATPADAPTAVTVSFTREDGGARVQGLTGNYVITLEKQ